MTIIGVALDKLPLLFGDLLLSTTANLGERTVHLPTQDIAVADTEEGLISISGLCQKTAIVNDYLAVGWSGSTIIARTIIREMIDNFHPNQPVSPDDVKNFLSRVDYHEDKVSIVGMTLEKHSAEKGFVKYFSWGKAQTYSSAVFDELILAGSGSGHFVETLNNTDSSSFERFNEIPAEVRALGKVLLLSGTIIGEEVATGRNLSSFYGGGLEFVAAAAGKFSKLADITYLFWRVDVLSPDKLSIDIHPLAIKFSYVRDILLVRRAKFSASLQPDLKTAERNDRTMLAISPVYRDLSQNEIQEIRKLPFLDLNSRWFCHYFFVTYPDTGPQIFVVADWNNQEMVRFEKKENRLYLAIHNNFHKRLPKIVFQRVRPRANRA